MQEQRPERAEDRPRPFPWRWLGGWAALTLFGVYTFVLGRRVPLLGGLDFFVHEAGHLLAMPLPPIGEAVMGSGLQVLVPLVFAVAFLLTQRDLLGCIVSLGWAATSLHDAHVYIADAPYQRLPIFAGATHDWAWIMGRLDAMSSADELARFVWLLGLACWLGAVALLWQARTLDPLVREGVWPPLPDPVGRLVGRRPRRPGPRAPRVGAPGERSRSVGTPPPPHDPGGGFFAG